MFRATINKSDLLLSKSFWFGHKWKPYRNLSEEVRTLKCLEQDAIKKANELTHLRMVGEANVKMDMTVLTHQLHTNSESVYEFHLEPSILDEREGVNYEAKGKQNNKQGASSNKDNGRQGDKSGSQHGGERSGNKQHNNGNNQQQSRGKGQAGRSLLDLLVSTKVH